MSKRVMLVTEKWCDGNPAAGPTNSQANFFNTLAASGLASFCILHFDEYYLRTARKVDSYLLSRCQEEKPDLVVFTYLFGSPLNPSIKTIQKLHRQGFGLAFIWFDGVYAHIQNLARSLAPFCRWHVCLDTLIEDSRYPERYIHLWTPQAPNLFFRSEVRRDIPISFCGSVRHYPDRQQKLRWLREKGMAVFQSGGQREAGLAAADYARVHQRSQIALNFSRAAFIDRPQLKGRVFEAMLCGAMLVEEDNELTRKFYTPMVDYVPFTDLPDLLEKTRHFQENEEERARIAESGYRKTLANYNHVLFWNKLLVASG